MMTCIQLKFSFILTVPSSGPLNVSLPDITSTSVSIQWSSPLPHQHNGIIRYYFVTLQEIATNTFITFNTTDLFIQLDNLHPDYDYNYYISAFTIGHGPLTNGTIKLLEDG